MIEFDPISVPGWPSGSAFSNLSSDQIIFKEKIEFCALTTLHLDIHKAMIEFDSISVPDWPPGSASN